MRGSIERRPRAEASAAHGDVGRCASRETARRAEHHGRANRRRRRADDEHVHGRHDEREPRRRRARRRAPPSSSSSTAAGDDRDVQPRDRQHVHDPRVGVTVAHLGVECRACRRSSSARASGASPPKVASIARPRRSRHRRGEPGALERRRRVASLHDDHAAGARASPRTRHAPGGRGSRVDRAAIARTRQPRSRSVAAHAARRARVRLHDRGSTTARRVECARDRAARSARPHRARPWPSSAPPAPSSASAPRRASRRIGRGGTHGGARRRRPRNETPPNPRRSPAAMR